MNNRLTVSFFTLFYFVSFYSIHLIYDYKLSEVKEAVCIVDNRIVGKSPNGFHSPNFKEWVRQTEELNKNSSDWVGADVDKAKEDSGFNQILAPPIGFCDEFEE